MRYTKYDDDNDDKSDDDDDGDDDSIIYLFELFLIVVTCKLDNKSKNLKLDFRIS